MQVQPTWTDLQGCLRGRGWSPAALGGPPTWVPVCVPPCVRGRSGADGGSQGRSLGMSHLSTTGGNHLCGFKRWTESKELRVAMSCSTWGHCLVSETCLKGQAASRAVRSSSPALAVEGVSAQAAAWSGPPAASKPLSLGHFMKFPLIFFFPNISKI